MNWTTPVVIVAVVAFGGLILFGLWCAVKVFKDTMDDIWNILGW